MIWWVEPVKSVNDTWYDIYWFHALKLSQVVVRCQTMHELRMKLKKSYTTKEQTYWGQKVVIGATSPKLKGHSACLSLMTIITESRGSNCCKIFRILAWTTTQNTWTKTEFWSTSVSFPIFRLYIFMSFEKNKPGQKITFRPWARDGCDNDRNARKFYYVSINNLPVRSDFSKKSSC